MQTRRDFLSGLSKAAVALGVNVFDGVAIEGAIFRNDHAGLILRRPNGWSFDSIADFSALRARQRLLDVELDEDHPLRDPKNLPILLISDPAHRRGHFAPATALYDEPLLFGRPSDEEDGHLGMLYSFMDSYAEMRIIEMPSLANLNGTPATVSEWSYRHEIDSGESFHLWVRTILVFRPGRSHIYHLVDSLKGRHISPGTWQRLQDSIRYERPMAQT